MTGGIIRYNFENIHPQNDSGQLWLKLALWFQRRRFFRIACAGVTDRQTTSDP